MKITLKHPIKLKEAEAYCFLETLQKCPDIADFLTNPNQEKFKDNALRERIYKFLQTLGFLDENRAITKEGEQVKERKKRFIKEEGKYKITFSQKDSIFSNRLFSFKREKPDTKDNPNNENFEAIHFQTDKEFLTLDEQTFKLTKGDCKFNHIKSHNTILYISEASCHEKWKVLNYTQNHNFLEPQSFITKAKAYYKSNNGLEKLDFSTLKDLLKAPSNTTTIRDIREFRADMHLGEWEFKDMPLSPSDKESAKEWLKECLLKDLEESYLTKNEYNTKCEHYLYNTPLRDFNNDLEKIELEHIATKKNTKAFWHSKAISDLLPLSNLSTPIKSITIKVGEKITLQKIATQLKRQNEKVYKIISIDRYVRTEIQQKIFLAFIHAFETTTTILLTRDNDKQEHHKMLKDKNITLKYFKDIPNHKNEPHDRFLILQYKNKEIDTFLISTPIDSFLEINDSEKLSNIAEYTTKKSSKISKQESYEGLFDKPLEEFLNKELNG